MADTSINVLRTNAKELAKALRNAAMVRAIYETTKVANSDRNIVHFVAQNYLGMAAPVSIQVASPTELHKRCRSIFVGEYVPKLANLHKMKPLEFTQWIKSVESDKGARLVEIRQRFQLVKDQDERITDNLLVGQRAFISLEVGLLATVAAIPAAAFVLGASAATIGGSVSTAMAYGIGISGVHFVAKTASEVYNSHVIVFDKLGEVLASTFTYAGHKMMEGISEDGEHFLKIHEETEKTLQLAGEELAKDPHFAAYMSKAALAKEVAPTLKTAGKLGVVCCAVAEIWSLVAQGRKDWYAGTSQAEK